MKTEHPSARNRTPKIWRRNWIWFVVLIVVTALSRGFLAERDMGGFSYDSGNYALAAQDYSLQQNRPHLPGYYLHVLSIRLLNRFFYNVEESMVFLSILYSALAAGIIFLLMRKWFSLSFSVLAVLVIISNPLVWFYGLISEIYAFDLFFGALLCLAGLSRRGIFWTPAILALGTGVRPSSGVLLLPLYVYLWFRMNNEERVSPRKIISAHLLGAVLFFAWLVPMIQSAGGPGAYLRLFRDQNPVDPIGLRQNIFRFSSFFVFAGIPLIIAAAGGLITGKTKSIPKRMKQMLSGERNRIFLWWFLPALLFFVFVHYSKGYFLIIIAPFLIFFLQGMAFSRRGRSGLVLIVIIQSALFLFLPYFRPDPQIYLVPGERTINLGELWLSRTFSVYEMAYDRLKTLEGDAREVRRTLRESQNLRGKNSGSVPPVFVDPTSPLSVRVFQAQNTERQWASMSLTEPDIYGWYSGPDQFRRTGLASLLSKAVIISRPEFVRRYLAGFNLKYDSAGDLLIFSVPEEEAGRLAKRYRELFVRTGEKQAD